MSGKANALRGRRTVTSGAPSAGAGLTLATLVLSWTTRGRCRIQRLFSRSEHLYEGQASIAHLYSPGGRQALDRA
jgi:hypothetical protein